MRLSLFRNSNRTPRARTARGIVVAGVLLIVLASAPVAPASNPWTYLARSSSGMTFFQVHVLYTLSDGLRFWFQHEAEAIDFVRRALVRQGKIQDLPVAVAVVFEAAKPSRVALVPGCTAWEGQGGGQLVGRCYVVLYRGALSPEGRDGHENLLALTVSLPGLSPARVGIDFSDLNAVKTARAAEIASFSGIVQHFDPIWSPDGTRLLYTVWDSGRIRLELLDPSSGNVTRLEPLEGQMTVRPIWSDDSRFVAYASLQTVKVFDTQTRTTRTLRRQTSSSEMRTAILFEGARLRILFDHMTTEGELLDYDAAQGNLQKQQYASGAGRPEWVRRAEKHGLALDLHASLKPVRSPTGRFVAFFTFVDGQRRIEVKALQ